MDKYNNNFINKYSDKIKLNRKNLANNKNKSSSNKSDEDYNYFLNGENLELQTFNKNTYQSQYINKTNFNEKAKKNKNKYNIISDSQNEINKLKDNSNNSYFDNSSYIKKNINKSGNNNNNSYAAENFENGKNQNINNILLNMKKEVLNINSERKEYNNFNMTNEFIKTIKLDKNDYNTSDSVEELFNDYSNDLNKNQILKNEQLTLNKKNNNNINNKRIFVIDKSEQNNFNIYGISEKNDLSNIDINKLKKDQMNKLKSIYSNRNNKVINVEQLINDLYDYKIKYQEIQNLLNSKNIKEAKKEINQNLSKIKEENIMLNLQKKFLINELTKSIYNHEKLRYKYKDELERFDSYLNKIKFDINENNINI